MVMWCLKEGKMVKCVQENAALMRLALVILLIDSVQQPSALGQMIYDTDISNEIFGQSIYDDAFLDIPAPSEFNFTTYPQYHLINNLYDRTTRKGLDITSPHLFQSKTGAQLNAVFPGTVWCGLGNLAGNNQILGFFAHTDDCCRTHDNCQLTIPPGETKFGLTNDGYFSRSHCICDEKFYYCLKKANSVVAKKVGFTYFNLLRPQCFRRDFPIAACVRWYNDKCLVYIVDQTYGREWQWFDNKEF